MHTTFFTVLRRDALFHPRGALGRRRALVVPALERMTWTPAEPLCGCARNALSFCALNGSTKTTRVGREAPREIRDPTREKDGTRETVRWIFTFSSPCVAQGEFSLFLM